MPAVAAHCRLGSGDNFSSNLFTFSQEPGGNRVQGSIDLSHLPDLTGAVSFRIRNLSDTAANGGTVGGDDAFT
ncbi:MAG TPA: hypothetical protein DCY89_03310 [Gammaproteobacteria bacterium]|nr:hypothetical protein [Gammaproteobacteria bacterium]